MSGLDDLGLNAGRLIAGFAGGLVHAFAFKQMEPWAQIGSVVVGTLTANFLGEAMAHVVPTWFGNGGAAFLTGLSAMAICQGLVAMVRSRMNLLGK
jgi:hypothetical protein